MSTLAVIILREPLYAESQAGNESDKEDCRWFGRAAVTGMDFAAGERHGSALKSQRGSDLIR